MKLAPLFALGLLAATPLLGTPSEIIDGATAEVYKTASETELQIHRLDPPGYDPEGEASPALVLFFGGGWNGGSPTHLEPQGRYFAERGMIVFLADYRTKSKHGTTPLESSRDAVSAMRWVYANADRLGVDVSKIAAGGGSAGGHLAALTGICEGFDEPDADLGIPSQPTALVLFNPVYDNGPDGYGHERVADSFPAISPAHNLTASAPPTIVFLGTEDKLIPVATAAKFQAEQKALGIRSDLHLYEGEPHGFFNLKVGQGKPEHFVDTVLKADQFLIDLGFLGGAPDPAILDPIIARK